MRLRVPAGLSLFLAGCGGGTDPGPSDTAELARRLAEQQRQMAEEAARHAAEVTGLQSDFNAAVLIWGGTAVAVVVLILVLARERRSRRALDHLLRRVLDRFRTLRDSWTAPRR